MNLLLMIKELRTHRPGTGLKDAKIAAEKSDGTLESALNELDKIQKEWSFRLDHPCLAKKVFSYVHNNAQIGVLLELCAETDFVTRNDLFTELGKNICLQATVSENAWSGNNYFMNEPFIKDPEKTIRDLINTTSSLMGERIEIGRLFKINTKIE